jgi:L-aspartate oxidase
MDEPKGEIYLIKTRATIIATGGIGRVYSRTTNPPVVTGDGIAMAFRAGAELEDMEFIQFHPTSLFLPGSPPFLLSEAMRGEGAVIRNINKEAFLPRHHSDAEMAPRDVVARAIWLEMQATGSRHVYLDLTSLDPVFIRGRFPKIYATCLQYDLDITEEMIPVSPAAHFIMGGIKTDINGATNIRSLYAAGEAACTGVHGANRLASNSLLEGLVFGSRAGEEAAKVSDNKEVVNGKLDSLASDLISDYGEGHKEHRDDSDKIINSIRKLMWDKTGIVRSKDGLDEALISIKELCALLNKRTQTSRADLELKNILTIAQLITTPALAREGSIGAHYRTDFPDKGDRWDQHLGLRKGEAISQAGGPDTQSSPQVYWYR